MRLWSFGVGGVGGVELQAAPPCVCLARGIPACCCPVRFRAAACLTRPVHRPPVRRTGAGLQVIFVVGVQCQRPPIPDDCPAMLSQLISRCWDDDPGARPAFPEVVARLKVGAARDG